MDEPIIGVSNTALDTHNLYTYDPYTGKYVAYMRGHVLRRRLVRLAKGTDFRHLDEPRFCLMPDPQDPFDNDIYNPCYCPYRGGSSTSCSPRCTTASSPPWTFSWP